MKRTTQARELVAAPIAQSDAARKMIANLPVLAERELASVEGGRLRNVVA